MNKGKVYLILGLFFIAVQINAQDGAYVPMQQDSIYAPVQTDRITIGIGGGLDYGGLGANFLFYPVKSVGLFVGAGYALSGLGVNGGAKFRLVSKKTSSKFTPYALAMYGYNAAVYVQGAEEFNKLFYGPSFGIGFDYRSRPEKRGYWSFALLVPIRSQEAKDYIDDLEQNQGVEFGIGLLPVAFSFGYRFILL
jgi:hypothetical protein